MVADIGRNLTLQSQQDRDYYHSQQSNISAGASFTFGSMSGSASISGSRQKADSDFVSVQQQTGFYAGQGGFDIQVGRHTQLDGAVIASTAKADKNTLDTGTLGFSNQHNQADYKVESQSFGFSSSSGGSLTGTLKGTLMSQGASSVLGGGNSSGHAESTTYAAVSEGAIKIRDQDQQQQDLKALSRDAEHAANGLSPIFDKEKELNRLQEAQLIGQIGAQATQIVATEMMMKANEELRRNPAYADSEDYKKLNAKWGTGSDFQRAAQAATAALQGLAGGNVQAALSGAAAPYLAGVVKNLTDGNKEANVMAHALLGATLAQMKGESAAAGAAGGATAPIVADLLLTQLYPGKKVEDLNESQKQTISALTTMAGSLAGSLAGGNSAGALTGAQTAKNEVENNYLSNSQTSQKKKELEQCRTLACVVAVHGKWSAVSKAQDAAFIGGLAAGVPANLFDMVTDVAKVITSPVETYESVRQLLKSDAIFSTLSSAVKQSYLDRIDRLEAEYQKAGANGAFQAGVEAGKLLTDAAGLIAGGASLAKSGVKLAQKVTETAAERAIVKAISEVKDVKNIKPDNLLPEADFSGRIPVREDLAHHLSEAKLSGKQISGGHNEERFMEMLKRANGEIVKKVEIVPGIYEVEYKLGGKNYNGALPKKTVYQPSVYSDAKMTDMALEAAHRGAINYQVTGRAPQYVKIGDVVFEVPINTKTGQAQIRTVFPSKEPR